MPRNIPTRKRKKQRRWRQERRLACSYGIPRRIVACKSMGAFSWHPAVTNRLRPCAILQMAALLHCLARISHDDADLQAVPRAQHTPLQQNQIYAIDHDFSVHYAILDLAVAIVAPEDV